MTCAANSPVKPRHISVTEAKHLSDIVDRTPLTVGDKWFLISDDWWKRFLHEKDLADDQRRDTMELPPITNEKITEKTEDGYRLKPKQVDGLNYHSVPEKVFHALRRVFGVEKEERDVIERPVVKGTFMNKDAFIEVYPLTLKIAKYGSTDVVELQVSYAETLDEIKTKALDALDIAEENRTAAKFLIEAGGRYEEVQPAISSAKLSSLLSMEPVIYVDETGKVMEKQKSDELNGNVRSYGYAAATSRDRYQKGLCGLQNLGNTCFMNSALQCLSNVPELTQYFLCGRFREEINTSNVLGTGGKLVRAYADLLGEMWSGTMSSARPTSLKYVIGQFAPRFNGYSQQDSQELLSFLLDGLHEDLNRIHNKPYIEEKEANGRPDSIVAKEAWDDYRKRNDSIIVDLLHGQLKSTLVCPVCSKVSVKFDPFCFLSVPVPAKERQSKSNVTFIRAAKWAKFALTHTSKTTVGQVIEAIKKNLEVPAATKIILMSGSGSDILSDDVVMTTSGGFTSYVTPKNYYAYAVDEGRPICVVENRTWAERNLGPPLVLNYDALSLAYVREKIVPACKRQLFRGSADESGNEDAAENNTYGDWQARLEVDREGLSFPEDPDQPVTLPEERRSPVRVILKWASPAPQPVDSARLVDRELRIDSQMKQSYSLDECVELFTSREQLDESESWYCPQCKKHQRAYKKLDLWRLPQILIVHLKRFQYTRYSRDKIDTDIGIPVKGFDLSSKVVNPEQKSAAKYDLIGISNHMGGLGGGHYTAKALGVRGNWCDFNDSMASESDSQPSARDAYILVFRRVDGTEPSAAPAADVKANNSLRVSARLRQPSSSPSRNGSSPSTTRASSSNMEVDG